MKLITTPQYEVIIYNGRYYAPSIYVNTGSEKQALEEAKQKSRLSSFDTWVFVPYKRR